MAEPRYEPAKTAKKPNSIKIIISLKKLMYSFSSKLKNNLKIQELKVVRELKKPKHKNNLNFSEINNLFTKPNPKHPKIFTKKIPSIFHLIKEPNIAPKEIRKNLFFKTLLIIIY